MIKLGLARFRVITSPNASSWERVFDCSASGALKALGFHLSHCLP